MTEIPPKSNNPVEKPFDGGKAICSISPYSNLAYMHSFGMTDNFFIVVENPLLLSITKLLLRSIVGYSYADALYWDPDQFSIFHVIERSSGSRVGRFTSQPFFCFHHINAFEDEESGNIVVDLCGYKDATIVQELYLQHLRSGKPVSRSDVRRYKLPLGELREPQRTKRLSKDAEGLDHEVLFSGLELPQFNYGCFNGKPYRYFYLLFIEDVELSCKNTSLRHCYNTLFFTNNFMRTRLKFAKTKRTNQEQLSLGFMIRCKCNCKFLLRITTHRVISAFHFAGQVFLQLETLSEQERSKCRSVYTAIINLCCGNTILQQVCTVSTVHEGDVGIMVNYYVYKI